MSNNNSEMSPADIAFNEGLLRDWANRDTTDSGDMNLDLVPTHLAVNPPFTEDFIDEVWSFHWANLQRRRNLRFNNPPIRQDVIIFNLVLTMALHDNVSPIPHVSDVGGLIQDIFRHMYGENHADNQSNWSSAFDFGDASRGDRDASPESSIDFAPVAENIDFGEPVSSSQEDRDAYVDPYPETPPMSPNSADAFDDGLWGDLVMTDREDNDYESTVIMNFDDVEYESTVVNEQFVDSDADGDAAEPEGDQEDARAAPTGRTTAPTGRTTPRSMRDRSEYESRPLRDLSEYESSNE